MMRVCKPGGVVAITVPAFMLLWSRHDVVNHHHRRYRVNELTRLFQASGRVLYATYFNSLLCLPIVTVRGLTKLVAQRWIRRGSGSDFSLVKSPAPDRIFFNVLRSETVWMRRRLSAPFGVSAFLSWQKA